MCLFSYPLSLFVFFSVVSICPFSLQTSLPYMATRSHDSVVLSILALNVLSINVYSCTCFYLCVFNCVFVP